MSKKYIEPDKNLFCPNPSSEAVLTPQYDPSLPESIPIHQRYCNPLRLFLAPSLMAVSTKEEISTISI